jgi:hypothetical protein
VHQVGNQPRLYYDSRSTNHQEKPSVFCQTNTHPYRKEQRKLYEKEGKRKAMEKGTNKQGWKEIIVAITTYYPEISIAR